MKHLRKLICAALCAITLIGCMPFSALAATDNATVTPRYNNTTGPLTNFNIVNDVAEIYVRYDGYEGVTTGATITITLEKKFLLVFWTEVETWTLTSNSANFSQTVSCDVSSGTHRATVVYEIYGSGGSTDVITYEEEVKN